MTTQNINLDSEINKVEQKLEEERKRELPYNDTLGELQLELKILKKGKQYADQEISKLKLDIEKDMKLKGDKVTQKIIEIIDNRIKHWEEMISKKKQRNIPNYQNFISSQYCYERIHELEELKGLLTNEKS